MAREYLQMRKGLINKLEHSLYDSIISMTMISMTMVSMSCVKALLHSLFIEHPNKENKYI